MISLLITPIDRKITFFDKIKPIIENRIHKSQDPQSQNSKIKQVMTKIKELNHDLTLSPLNKGLKLMSKKKKKKKTDQSQMTNRKIQQSVTQPKKTDTIIMDDYMSLRKIQIQKNKWIQQQQREFEWSYLIKSSEYSKITFDKILNAKLSQSFQQPTPRYEQQSIRNFGQSQTIYNTTRDTQLCKQYYTQGLENVSEPIKFKRRHTHAELMALSNPIEPRLRSFLNLMNECDSTSKTLNTLSRRFQRSQIQHDQDFNHLTKIVQKTEQQGFVDKLMICYD